MLPHPMPLRSGEQAILAAEEETAMDLLTIDDSVHPMIAVLVRSLCAEMPPAKRQQLFVVPMIGTNVTSRELQERLAEVMVVGYAARVLVPKFLELADMGEFVNMLDAIDDDMVPKALKVINAAAAERSRAALASTRLEKATIFRAEIKGVRMLRRCGSDGIVAATEPVEMWLHAYIIFKEILPKLMRVYFAQIEPGDPRPWRAINRIANATTVETYKLIERMVGMANEWHGGVGE